MNWVTIVYSMVAASSLTLLLVHLPIGIRRRNWPSAAFSLMALSAAGVAACELLLVRSTTLERYGEILRWIHVPIWLLTVSMVVFVRSYLQAGGAWLAWSSIAARSAALIVNFLQTPNLNYDALTALRRFPLWGGETVSVTQGIPSHWTHLGELSSALLALFLADAAHTVWRRGDKRQAVTICGSMLLFVVVSGTHAALVHAGIIQSPYILSLCYTAIVAAMAYELTTQVYRTAELTQQIRATERALHDSERQAAMAAETGAVGFWAWDLARDEIWLSEQARRACGFGMAERVDLGRLLDTIHVDDRERLRLELDKCVRNGGRLDIDFRDRRPDGTTRWIAARGRFEAEGKRSTRRMLGVAVDITKLKLAELEIAQQRNQLAHLSRVTTLGELLGSLAHELSQPLTAILHNAQAAQRFLIKNDYDRREIVGILAEIIEQDRRAAEVIRRLRALLTRGEVSFQQFDVSDIVADALKVLHAELVARGVEVSTTLASDLPPVDCDRVQIEQVLLNLITNGCDAMDAVDRPRRQIVVSTELGDDGAVRLSVRDRGVGIPEGLQDRVFQPFFTTKPSGMGLGLAVCRTIITAHGGRLWAESNVDGGATFCVALPVAHPST